MSLMNEHKVKSADWEAAFSLACQLFQTGAFSEACRLFSELQNGQPENPAGLINLSLCLMRAEQWEAAAGNLDQALRLMKKCPSVSVSALDETRGRLMELEQRNDSYLMPLPESAPRLAPEHTRIVIRRLLIDCCARLGQTERVQRLAGALQSRHYQNVEQAVQRVREQEMEFSQTADIQ